MNIIKEKWEEILDFVRIEHELTPVSFNTWLKPLKVHSFENGLLYILVPDKQQTAVSYISKKYLLPIKVAIDEITGIDCEIEFILMEDIKRKEVQKPDTQKMNLNIEKANLNPRYTFDTFVVVYLRRGRSRKNTSDAFHCSLCIRKECRNKGSLCHK